MLGLAMAHGPGVMTTPPPPPPSAEEPALKTVGVMTRVAKDRHLQAMSRGVY